MRIPKTFGERTESERKVLKKYYLIYEGFKTEVQYFAGITDVTLSVIFRLSSDTSIIDIIITKI